MTSQFGKWVAAQQLLGVDPPRSRNHEGTLAAIAPARGSNGARASGQLNSSPLGVADRRVQHSSGRLDGRGPCGKPPSRLMEGLDAHKQDVFFESKGDLWGRLVAARVDWAGAWSQDGSRTLQPEAAISA